MATLTRLASTLTAKYFPSSSLTDAFYMDGRLNGKRETKQADITIDKEERGFFFSVFTHPTIPGFEIGTLPPFEPQLRGMCNEVKFGHKEIDGMIEKFLSTAVDVSGKMRLTDPNARSPYFSGIIVRDSEAFAVTIGNGLAFLFRDDTLFPLTDAGVPMEPIDAYGNRVGDFNYFCSSKTANALWSNFFTLSPDDCIILCNKAVYDALGQREILRILTDADDQCDAAGVVITQASARMPNTPMQFSISFVESVTADEKKGLFGRKKKVKEEDTSDMSIKSTIDGGVVGAAAKAAADAGFVNFAAETAGTAAAAAAGTAAGAAAVQAGVEFLDKSVDESKNTDPSPEEVMKKLFGEVTKQEAEKEIPIPSPEASPFVVSVSETPAEPVAPVVAEPVAPVAVEPVVPQTTVSDTPFTPEVTDEPTKPVDASVLGLRNDGLLAQALKELGEQKSKEEAEAAVEAAAETVVPEVTEVPEVSEEIKETTEILRSVNVDATPDQVEKIEVKDDVSDLPFAPVDEKISAVPPDVTGKPEEIVFAPENSDGDFLEVKTPSAEDSFDPYSVGDSEEMKNAGPFVFGDSANSELPVEIPSEDVSEIPVPDFEINNPKPEIKEEDKLNVDFPEFTKAEEPEAEPVQEVSEPESDEGTIVLPFANGAETVAEPEAPADIPEMPTYDGNTFDTPVNAVSSEETIGTANPETLSYGEYEETDPSLAAPPYQPYGSEPFTTDDQDAFGKYEDTITQANNYDNSYEQFEQRVEEYPDAGAGTQDTAAQAYAETQTMDDNNMYPNPEYDSGTASASSGNSVDDDWIMGILGMDDDNEPAPAAAPQTPPPYARGGAPKSQYNPTAGRGPNAQASARPGSPANPYGAPSGGNRKVKMKLNRNGYAFLAVCGVFIILLIVAVVVIAKSCGDKEIKPAETSQTSATETTNDVLKETKATEATTEPDPTAPIARFKFSENIGFRTWWDVFHYAYGIDLADSSDPKIAIIIEYNKFDPATYKPNAGDEILLPPKAVIEGTVSSGSNAGSGETTPGETTSADELNGTVKVQDGGETTAAAAETTAAGAAETTAAAAAETTAAAETQATTAAAQ